MSVFRDGPKTLESYWNPKDKINRDSYANDIDGMKGLYDKLAAKSVGYGNCPQNMINAMGTASRALDEFVAKKTLL